MLKNRGHKCEGQNLKKWCWASIVFPQRVVWVCYVPPGIMVIADTIVVFTRFWERHMDTRGMEGCGSCAEENSLSCHHVRGGIAIEGQMACCCVVLFIFPKQSAIHHFNFTFPYIFILEVFQVCIYEHNLASYQMIVCSWEANRKVVRSIKINPGGCAVSWHWLSMTNSNIMLLVGMQLKLF